jgi:hypothetical protein
VTSNRAALERFLDTDPADIGCGQAMEILHVYVDLVAADRDAGSQYPGVAAHLAACGPCGEDYQGLLAAVTGDLRDLRWTSEVSALLRLASSQPVGEFAPHAGSNRQHRASAVHGRGQRSRCCNLLMDLGDRAADFRYLVAARADSSPRHSTQS